MWHAIFDMNCGLNGERPEPIAQIRIDEHGARHRSEREIATFGDAILAWRFGYGFFVSYPFGFAVLPKFPFGQLGGIVDAEDSDLFTAKSLSESAEFDKALECFVTGFHEIGGDVSRIATNE
jgi:hypothetical protein